MASYAASGGYYIATGADKIVAQPGTITGSIGVVVGKMTIGKLLEQVGVGIGEVRGCIECVIIGESTNQSQRVAFDACTCVRAQV